MIEAVSQWRLLYSGFQLNGTSIKMSLDEAAKIVKISKKSLDDYLMILKQAKRFNFNFEKHANDKIGVIRAFVQKKKNEERR